MMNLFVYIISLISLVVLIVIAVIAVYQQVEHYYLTLARSQTWYKCENENN